MNLVAVFAVFALFVFMLSRLCVLPFSSVNKWMIKQLGPPTLFITCSCAERFSEHFINYLRSVTLSK